MFVSYTGFVFKRVIIALEADLAERVHKRASEQNIPVSVLIARLLEREMYAPNRYWRAFQDWKERDRNLGIAIDASKRFTRDEAHER